MEELKRLPLWSHCKKTKNGSLKAPVLGLGKVSPVIYEIAKQNAEKETASSPYYGIVFPKDTSNYIGFDVDVDSTGKKEHSSTAIPAPLLFFLSINKTHIHYSPNGEGIHFIYKVNKSTQELLNKWGVQQKPVKFKSGGMFIGDFRYRNCFLIYTKKHHPLSVNKIAELSLEKLLEIIPNLKPDEPKVEVQNTVQQHKNVRLPTVQEVKTLLNNIPSTFTSRVEKLCRDSLPYTVPENSYSYWVMICNACAYASLQLLSCARVKDHSTIFKLFLEWSKKDKQSYVSEDDVLEKFKSCIGSTRKKVNSGQRTITLGTLQILANATKINFPVLIGKKGHLKPDPNALKNIDALMEYEEMELYFDPMANGFCFKGPEHTIQEYFCPDKQYTIFREKGFSQVCNFEDMTVRFLKFMQSSTRFGPSVSISNATNAVKYLNQNKKQENAFKRWIASEKWDGISRFKSVYQSITVPKHEMKYIKIYENYIKNALLSLVGIHFWVEDGPTIPAMLILSGPENTYKSTWGDYLIPYEMSRYKSSVGVPIVQANSHDWLVFLHSSAVVIIDECEPIFHQRYEQVLKSSIDQKDVTYRMLFTSTKMNFPRTALIIGTTNEQNLYTGSQGTRKLWQIPVERCNTEILDELHKKGEMQQLYAEIYHILQEYKKANPNKRIQTAWAQSEEDRTITNTLNAQRKGTDVGTIGLIAELFGSHLDRTFDINDFITDKKVNLRQGSDVFMSATKLVVPNCWSITQMEDYLRLKYPHAKLKRSWVARALKEYASRYTNTINKSAEPFIDHVSSIFYSKTIFQGGYVERSRQKLFLMPPPLELEESEIDVDISKDEVEVKLKEA
jgi:hypothetical protein